VYTRFTYAAGMQTSMWVDLDGDNAVDSDDQVTTYTYGVVKGASAADSKISSNRLLKKATYPEQYSMQAAADREVNFAYNAQGQEVYKKDQATNVIETVYDTGGRVTTRKFTTINTGAGFDDAVKRIEMAYLGRGLADTVTQYDATSSGTALDQVQYSYDDWGNLTKFEQDPDSAIGGGGRAAYSVQYTLQRHQRHAQPRRAAEGAGHPATLDQEVRLRAEDGQVADPAFLGVVHLVGEPATPSHPSVSLSTAKSLSRNCWKNQMEWVMSGDRNEHRAVGSCN